MGMMYWVYVFQVCYFHMVVLHGGAYFKRDDVECENIWHNSQVTFLDIVLLWFCMRGPILQCIAPRKRLWEGRGSQAGSIPLTLMKPEALPRCFPNGSLWTHPVLTVFQNAVSTCSFYQMVIILIVLSSLPGFAIFCLMWQFDYFLVTSFKFYWPNVATLS